MSQAPTSSLWTEDDDLTDEEEDQTLLGDDAYVEPVVPAEASRREDRRGLRVLAVVSLSVAPLAPRSRRGAAARRAARARGRRRARVARGAERRRERRGGPELRRLDGGRPRVCVRQAASAAACDASGDGRSWTAFEQCYPLEDLGMDVQGARRGEVRARDQVRVAERTGAHARRRRGRRRRRPAGRRRPPNRAGRRNAVVVLGVRARARRDDEPRERPRARGCAVPRRRRRPLGRLRPRRAGGLVLRQGLLLDEPQVPLEHRVHLRGRVGRAGGGRAGGVGETASQRQGAGGARVPRRGEGEARFRAGAPRGQQVGEAEVELEGQVVDRAQERRRAGRRAGMRRRRAAVRGRAGRVRALVASARRG